MQGPTVVYKIKVGAIDCLTGSTKRDRLVIYFTGDANIMRYRDPDEREYEEKPDNKPEIIRELVKARLHMRTIVITLPHEVREPVGIIAGNKIMQTVVNNETDLKQILRDGKSGILLTKE